MERDDLLERAYNTLRECTSQLTVDAAIQIIDSHVRKSFKSASMARLFWADLSAKIGRYRSLREDQSGSALNKFYQYAAKQAAKKAKSLTPSS